MRTQRSSLLPISPGSSLRVPGLILLILALAWSALAPPAARACGGYTLDLQTGVHLATQAVEHAGPNEIEDVARALRTFGPQALDALRAAWPGDPTGWSEERRAFLDQVCAQRDCADSLLFWHTDLESARQEAQATGKPIVSLRLLGNLDEEMSCANSRFFRSVLYPNAKLRKVLRDDVILHWHSVRPVPKVTIELGDGRIIERTLVGNSLHYVLDAHGRPIDVLPGLYGPQTFQRRLAGLIEVAHHAAELSDYELRQVRQQRLHALSREIVEEREATLARFEEERQAAIRHHFPNGLPPGLDPSRIRLRDERTMAKSSMVNPILDALAPASQPSGPWQQLARIYLEEAVLDEASRRMVLRKQGVEPSPDADLMVAAFEESIAADTALNEAFLRPEILGRLASWEDHADLERLTAWIYREVFRDPGDDPWLGLAPADAYAALPQGGLREPAP